MSDSTQQLGKILLQRSLIDRNQLSRALRLQKRAGLRLGSNLLEIGAVSEADLLAALGEQRQLHTADGEALKAAAPAVLRLVPKSAAVGHSAVPFAMEGNALWVASVDPLPIEAQQEIAESSSRLLKIALALEVRVMEQLGLHFELPTQERVRNILLALDHGRRKISRAPTEELMFKPVSATDQDDPSWIGMRPNADRGTGTRSLGQLREALEQIDLDESDEGVDAPSIEDDLGEEIVEGGAAEPDQLPGLDDPFSAPPWMEPDGIDTIDDSEHIAQLLLDACAPLFATRALLWLEDNERVMGWLVEGEDIDPTDLAALEISLAESPVLSRVVETALAWPETPSGNGLSGDGLSGTETADSEVPAEPSSGGDEGLSDAALRAIATAIGASHGTPEEDPTVRVLPIESRRCVVGFLYLARAKEAASKDLSRLAKIRPLIEALAERLIDRNN